MSDEQREAAWEQWKKLETIWGEEPPSRTDFMGGWDAAMAAKEGPVQIDREALAVARNFVNQLGDLWSERIPSPDWVKVRQATNDHADRFVSLLLSRFLAAQPVTGTVEWEYVVRSQRKSPPRTYDSPVTDEETARLIAADPFDGQVTRQILRRRKADEWQEVN